MIVTPSGLMLEPQMAAHAAEMFDVLGDPALYEFENEPPASPEWLRARYERLESRRSPDGREAWLNWVIRVPGAGLVGYVQATVREECATIAYVLSSRHWGKGLARRAVEAMMAELAARHGVSRFDAVLKRSNHRSMRLLERLGFALGSPQAHRQAGVDADEAFMQKDSRPTTGRTPDPGARTPLQAPACPLCGDANECAAARAGTFDTPCWCTSAVFAPELLAAVPAASLGRACICRRCAASAATALRDRPGVR